MRLNSLLTVLKLTSRFKLIAIVRYENQYVVLCGLRQ